MPCRYRAENLDQKKPQPFRSHIDQSRRSSSRDQMPPVMDVGLHFNNILTIFGATALREGYRQHFTAALVLSAEKRPSDRLQASEPRYKFRCDVVFTNAK